MKAIGLTEHLPVTDDRCLFDFDLPTPKPTGHDLLVSVRAVSVNPVDTKVRSRGDNREDPPLVLGWDASGVVESVGDEVTLFRPGDEVYYAGSIVRPGTNSEYHLVDERIVGTKPKHISHAEAAALPLTALTAWEALFLRLRVPQTASDSKHRVLIIGGAGGVGSMALQIAKRVAGLYCIATASRPESTEWCKKLGADDVVNHRGDLVDQINELGFPEVDYVLCLNDLSGHWPAITTVVKPQGGICSIVSADGPIDVNLLMRKSLSFSYELMFTRSMFETPDLIGQHNVLNEVSRLADEGTLQSTLTSEAGPISAENLRNAHAQIESNGTIGKIVLQGWT